MPERPFDGAVYEPKVDDERLGKQIERIYAVLAHGGWYTLREIADRATPPGRRPEPEASVSAQLRHLRKPKHGGHEIEKRHRGAVASGLWEYHLVPRIVERLPERGPISLADARPQELPL